jgi:hypothetical protein
MDPPPPPPGPNPQEEFPRRIQQNALADVGGVSLPPFRAARGRNRLLDHALLALLLAVSWIIEDNRLLYPTMAIFLVFFGDNALRSINFLEATIVRQPLSPREYVLLGMLVVAKFNSMLVYTVPIALLTVYSGMHVLECLFQQQPRPPRHLLTALAVLWLVLVFKYEWLATGLFLGYVRDMPFTDSDGSQGRYTGQVNGVLLKPHDIGQVTYESGGKYSGYFENGVKSGRSDSIMEESNGAVHIGNFKDGKPNGHGVLVEKDGLMYDGEFVNAKMEGHGMMFKAGGEALFGIFHDAKLHGYGILRRTDCLINGNFKDGLPDGIAIAVDLNKDFSNMYIGNFQNGKRHGQGLLVTSNGLVQVGHWSDDQLHGHAEIIYPGYGFSGQFKHGKKHGHGVVTAGKSIKYEGEWRNGELVDGNLVLSNSTCANDDHCDEAES